MNRYASKDTRWRVLTDKNLNGVARTLKKVMHIKKRLLYQAVILYPFSKWKPLLKERICSQRERILSFKSSSLRYGKSLLPY